MLAGDEIACRARRLCGWIATHAVDVKGKADIGLVIVGCQSDDGKRFE